MDQLHKDRPFSECPTPVACWWHGDMDRIRWFRVTAQEQDQAPEWLLESVPADLEPSQPCTLDSEDCTSSCEAQDGGFIKDVVWNGMDAEGPCHCEHHEVRDLFGAWDLQAVLA